MTPDPSLPPFDELVQLHQRDPAAFDRLRDKLLQEAVDRAPPVHRPALTQLVGKMNQVRASATSDWMAAVDAFNMMQRSMRDLCGALRVARHRVADLQTMLLLRKISMKAAASSLPQVRKERRRSSRM